jgi:hypothetical protein
VGIDQEQGNRLVASLNPSTPDAVKVTLDLLDPDTLLPGHPMVPSKVNSVQATASGGTLSVSGSAAFNGEGPVQVAEDVAGDGPGHADLARNAGVDLVGARVYQPDPADPTLVFEWKTANLPAPGSLPEVVRYTWPFKLMTPSGEKTYQLQAKLTNVASVTVPDDPAGHASADRASGFFQLRGNCVTNYQGTPVANCPHITWLTGSFDTATDTVRINLPLGQTYAPDIAPGALLQPNVVATTTITASFQAVVSNAATSDEALWEEGFEYTVPDRTVALEVLPASGSNVLRSGNASVNQNGSFSGAVDVNGLAPGTYRLQTTACFGTNCGSTITDFTI